MFSPFNTRKHMRMGGLNLGILKIQTQRVQLAALIYFYLQTRLLYIIKYITICGYISLYYVDPFIAKSQNIIASKRQFVFDLLGCL